MHFSARKNTRFVFVYDLNFLQLLITVLQLSVQFQNGETRVLIIYHTCRRPKKKKNQFWKRHHSEPSNNPRDIYALGRTTALCSISSARSGLDNRMVENEYAKHAARTRKFFWTVCAEKKGCVGQQRAGTSRLKRVRAAHMRRLCAYRDNIEYPVAVYRVIPSALPPRARRAFTEIRDAVFDSECAARMFAITFARAEQARIPKTAWDERGTSGFRFRILRRFWNFQPVLHRFSTLTEGGSADIGPNFEKVFFFFFSGWQSRSWRRLAGRVYELCLVRLVLLSIELIVKSYWKLWVKS